MKTAPDSAHTLDQPNASAADSAAQPTRAGLTRAIVLTAVGLGIVCGLLAALVFAPRASLASPRTGDVALLGDVEQIVGAGAGLQSLAVVRIADGQAEFAGLGNTGADASLTTATEDPVAPNEDTVYELGSITKTFTGMLLADAVDRGEVSLDTTAGEVLDEVAGTPAGGTTLRDLSQHTSGLPRLIGGLPTHLRAFLGGDAYAGWTPERFLDEVAQAELSNPGEEAYSNAGTALLGHALARAAGAESWEALAQERIFDPLGMDSTVIAGPGFEESPDLARPHLVNGVEATPWTGRGLAAAGSSTRTTAGDMTRFATAVLDGSAPGAAALDLDDSGRGLGWTGLEPGAEGGADAATADSPIVWHNGGTEGTRTMLAIDRDAGTAAVVLSNSQHSVDEIALELIGADGAEYSAPGFGVLTLAPALVGLWFTAMAWFGLTRPSSGVASATSVLEGLLGALLLWVSGPWHLIPAVVLGVLAGLGVAAAVLNVMQARALPALPKQKPVGTWGSLALTALVGGFLVATL